MRAGNIAGTVISTIKTVQAVASRAERFQVSGLSASSTIGFVSTKAIMAGTVKARLPKNRTDPEREYEPMSTARPRRNAMTRDRRQDGAEKTNRASPASRTSAASSVSVT
ncbi:hypothetical protein DSECCO2_429940 [anaerobic digester metagenome]